MLIFLFEYKVKGCVICSFFVILMNFSVRLARRMTDIISYILCVQKISFAQSCECLCERVLPEFWPFCEWTISGNVPVCVRYVWYKVYLLLYICVIALTAYQPLLCITMARASSCLFKLLSYLLYKYLRYSFIVTLLLFILFFLLTFFPALFYRCSHISFCDQQYPTCIFASRYINHVHTQSNLRYCKVRVQFEVAYRHVLYE